MMTNRFSVLARFSFALCSLFLVASSAAQAEGKMAIKVGRIITQNGPDIENGIILIEDGRIKEVGSEVKIPWDAEVLDRPELVAFPGFVEAHSWRGMDRSNENLDVAPFLSIRDSVDPVNFYFQDALRWGTTTINVQHGNNCVIGARGLIVKPHGMTVEEMLVRTDSGIKISVAPKSGKSRATQALALRKAFGDLRRHLEKLVQEKKDGDDRARREALYQGRELDGDKAEGRAMKGDGWKVEGLESIPRGEIDEKLEPLLDLVEGRLRAYVYCGSPADVHTALEVAKENGFVKRTTLVLSSSCWKVADVIAAAEIPVILSSQLVHTERDPVTGEEKETFVPAVFAEKGVTYALQSRNQSTQSLWFQAAMCVGHGLPREQALNAVTRTPADILGLGDRVGSLEAGKDGNVVLFSGDPLSATSLVELVVIDGDLVYDRSEDTRAKHLIEGEQPENTAPVEDEEVPADGSEESSKKKDDKKKNGDDDKDDDKDDEEDK